MKHTPSAADKPLWSNRQLKAEAENIVVGQLSVNATYKVLQMIREEYEAERRQLQARISELEAQAIADGWNIADTDRRYHEAMEENDHLEQQLAQAGQRSAGEEAGTP